MKEKQKKRITLEDLSRKIDVSFARQIAKGNKDLLRKIEAKIDTKVDSRFDELARITKVGFDAVDQRFNTVESDMKTVKHDVESINLRLGYLAPQFEVEDLKKRVSRLEKKTGLSSA